MIAVTWPREVLGYTRPVFPPNTPTASMTISPTPSANAERRLAIARRIFEALATQNPNRAVTLCDGGGSVVAHHDPLLSDNGGLPHVKTTSLEDRCIDQN